MRERLKLQTASAHQRLDKAMSGLILEQRDSYVTFLRTHHLAYSALQHAIHDDHWIGDVLDDVLQSLYRDLARLQAAEVARPMIGVSAPLHPLGVAYVICGSHFGKRVLQKRWRRSSDPMVLAAGAYLANDVLAAGWTRFLAELEDLEEPAMDLEIMAATADKTFSLFYDCLHNVKHWERADAAA